MEQESLPQNKEELRDFIVRTFLETSENFIPTISDDEQEEIEELYGASLDKSRNEEDYEPL